MRSLWVLHRRLVVAVAIVVALVLSTVVVLAESHRVVPHKKESPASGPAARGNQVAPKTATHSIKQSQSKSPIRHLIPKSLVDPSQTAVQKRVDTELAQAETPASIAVAREAGVPAPAVSVTYPSIPTADRSDPSAYAVAFATELLDTNYATQSRAALLAWAEHEEAPNTLPGVPTAVAGKALVLSLADPNLPGGTPSPLPSEAEWAIDSQSSVVQSVSGIQAEVDPDWTEIVSEGWQPRDPLMTIETVTGTMTVTTGGQAAPPESFSLTLTLGSAAHVRAGYGAVAAGDWTLN
jgi:hypothetical protein